MNRRRFYRELSRKRTNDIGLNPLSLTLFTMTGYFAARPMALLADDDAIREM
jgi:hypothetical protein